jgi:hypothetical protein
VAYVPIKIATNLSSAIVEQNGYLLPINTTENWSEHFSTRSWTTPQDQIDAGYPIFIQPAASSGYYEEVFDCEGLLGNRQIVANFTGSALASTITTTTDISVSDDNVTYITYTDVSSLIVSDFRYIKVRVNVSSNSTGLYLLTDLDVVVNEQFDQDILPQQYVNNATFYVANVTLGAVTVTPNLYANNNQFFEHDVIEGQVVLQPSLYNNTNTFYVATLSVGGVSVTPELFANVNQFFEHDVVEGGLVLSPEIYNNQNVFYDASILFGGINLSPSLYENNNTFYDIAITGLKILVAEAFINTNAFKTATITAYNEISPSLFVNESVIFNANVIAEGVPQELNPQLFVNNSNFYVPSIQSTSRDSEFLGTFVRRRRTSKDIYNLPETPLKSKKRKTLEVLMMG